MSKFWKEVYKAGATVAMTPLATVCSAIDAASGKMSVKESFKDNFGAMRDDAEEVGKFGEKHGSTISRAAKIIITQKKH